MPKKFELTLFVLLLFSGIFGYAQNTERSIQVKYINDFIELDGILDEQVWEEADSLDNFFQFFPTDSVRAVSQTTVKILYDELNLYIGVRADAKSGNYVVSSLKRDFGGTSNDNISFLFDTFSDGANAFVFGVTPYGVQREGLVSEGGSAFNTTWDNNWQAESQMYDDHYVLEIAIPFTSLKFVEESQSWRFRAYRWDLQTNEQSTSARVPQNQMLSSLAYMNELVFEKPLGRSRTLLALIPYVNTLAEKDYAADNSNLDFKVGGDAKIAVSNGMNLDITINPDFSNVEVDDIFTNLTRFEVFLPEKRQFFIDNADLFSNYGSGRDDRPFFSRRIGIARDPEGNRIENQILGGVRLSGKLDQDWRLGFLNLQTAADRENEIASFNNSMLAFQKKMFSRSNLGFFVVNRQTFDDYDFLDPKERYNRVIGIDYDLASPDNVWTGNFYVHKSFQPDDSKGNFSTQAFIVRNTRNWRFAADLVYVDEEYRADLGFVPRKDIIKNGLSATRNFYPDSGNINRHSFGGLSVLFWRPTLNYQNTDQFFRFSWDAEFKDQSVLEAQIINNYIFLANPFDPTRSQGAEPLPGNRGYRFTQGTLKYQSNLSKLFTYGGEVSAGGFFNGESYGAGIRAGYRFQPWVQLNLAVNYDGIRLPQPYADADIWLVSPQAEVTFTKNLFWSTLVQYSNQRENLGINSRLQWRFAPLSDLFLVYNDNYFTNRFEPRYRSINLKFTYWLNL